MFAAMSGVASRGSCLTSSSRTREVRVRSLAIEPIVTNTTASAASPAAGPLIPPAARSSQVAELEGLEGVLHGRLYDLSPDPPNPRPDSAAGTRKQVPL